MSASKFWGFRACTDHKPKEMFPPDIVLSVHWNDQASTRLLSMCWGDWHLFLWWFPLDYCTLKVIIHPNTVLLPCRVCIHISGIWLAKNAHIFLLFNESDFFFLFWVIIFSFTLSNLSLISISFWLVCMFKSRSVEPRICR